MEKNYWLLTVTTESRAFRTVWYRGNLSSYVLMERNLGRNTNIAYSHPISQSEYENVRKELVKNKK